MDSGSSGSVQSSSGAEDEYDSRAEGFLNYPSLHVGPIPKPNPSPPPSLHSSSFDPFSTFLDPPPSRSPPNSLLNLHPSWPTNPRSDPNPIQYPASMTTTPDIQLQTPTHVVHSNNNNNTATVRNPRKRTRASRRAPTTVLTTDATNFRAMVQEFTGIPAPPFQPPSSSSFPRARLDLFAGASTSSPPYLLRPYPQKLSPFPSTNSLFSPSSIFNLPPPPPPLQQPNINLLRSHLHPNPLHLPLPEDFLSGIVRDGGGNNAPANWGSGTVDGGGGGTPSDQDLVGSTNVTCRSEGMVEPWICSSD